jgi:hypothetical protein
MALTAGISMAVIGVAGSLEQASAQKAQGKYQQQQLNFNSSVSELQATDAINRGNQEALAKRKQTKQVIGSQRAALAAQGIDVNNDTSVTIQQDTAALGAEDVMTIKNNAWREAWGYKVQAQDYQSQGEFARISANSNAKQTLLTGGLQAARDVIGGYSDYKKVK